MGRAGVLVVEGYALLRDITCEIVLRDPLLCVVGEARDAREAEEMVPRRCPDLVVVDMSLPGDNGLTLTRHLAEHYPALPIVVIGEEADPEYARLAYRAGATAYLGRQESLRELLSIIHGVLASGPEPRCSCGSVPVSIDLPKAEVK